MKFNKILHGANRPQTEWNIKIRAQNMKGRYEYYSKYKRRNGWKNSEKIETDCKWFMETC